MAGIFLYRSIRWAIIALASYLYMNCFDWSYPVFALPVIAAFAYCFSGVASLLVNFFVYALSEPLLLPEREDIATGGIPKDVKVVFFRPIFAKSNPEMDTLLNSMRQDIVNNQEPHKNLKFIVIDNTRDENVKSYTRQRIEELQGEYGKDVVYYFHRSVKCDFFKKLGIYQDAIMLLYEGWTRPGHYTDKKWDAWASGTRNPEIPTWDVIMGDVRALGIETDVEGILAGQPAKINTQERIKVAVISDADNVWPKGQIRKLVAKMVHADNKKYTIYQPSIEISNPNDNGYIKMTTWAREMYGFDPIARWRVYKFAPFYGKGAMFVENYVPQIIKREALHPGKAASHDFQEALYAWSVLLEDVYIMEKTFSNKLAELTRIALWYWGDLETVRQYLLKPFEAGRRAHLFTLLRNIIGPAVFVVWAIGQVLIWRFPVLAQVVEPEMLFRLFAIIVLTSSILPKICSPVMGRFKKKGYSAIYPTLSQKNIFAIIAIAALELVVSVLVHMQDLFYKPIASGRNYIQQATGKAFVWKTGAMSEIETQGASFFKTYFLLRYSVILGLILSVLCITKVLPVPAFILLSPYIASFLLGPAFTWIVARPLKRG
ncbi:MAG: hypothetical protein ABIH01_00660 [Candidatus Omnitrophota bacterium]